MTRAAILAAAATWSGRPISTGWRLSERGAIATTEVLEESGGKVDRWMDETGDPLLRRPIVPARSQAELLARAHGDGRLYLSPPAGARPNPVRFTKGEWQAVQSDLHAVSGDTP